MDLIPQGSTMVVFRLALLCKAARALTYEVHHLVREYLVIRLGVISPMVDELLWRCIQETRSLGFTLSGSIPPEHRTVGPITGQRNIVYQKAANEGEEQITVYVHMSDKDDTAGSSSLTLPWNMSVRNPRITTLMEDTRRMIDVRDHGYQRDIEGPWTESQWQRFCQLWLFGPPTPVQST